MAVTLDLGQGKELDDVRERAMAVGAVRCHVLDVRAEFAKDYVLPALQAAALYEWQYPLATALGRPLIARRLVEIAEMESAGTIAHGCTGKASGVVGVIFSARLKYFHPAPCCCLPTSNCTWKNYSLRS